MELISSSASARFGTQSNKLPTFFILFSEAREKQSFHIFSLDDIRYVRKLLLDV